jgi:hypothetical protein
MINTLSLQEAIEKCPAINATGPSARASKKYNFISTKEIVDQALSNDWCIRDVKKGRGLYGQHSINLVHKSQLLANDTEGFPQVSIINSHDLTKRFSLVLGFFRLICTNGLIAPSGLCNSTTVLHRQKSNGEHNDLIPSLTRAFDSYDSIMANVNKMKERQLSEEECRYLARFAHYSRFRYRMLQPKKFNEEAALKPRREVDAKKDLWSVFNVIQENFTNGGVGIGRGITQFQDEIRFNQELWSGVDKALIHTGENLENQLKQLFPKTKRKTNN